MLINCRSCGHEVSDKALFCPHCGSKNKPEWYKRRGVIALVVIIVVVLFIVMGTIGKDVTAESFLDEYELLMKEHADNVNSSGESLKVNNDRAPVYYVTYNEQAGMIISFLDKEFNQLNKADIEMQETIKNLFMFAICDFSTDEGDQFDAAQYSASALIDYFDDSVDGYKDAIEKYFDIVITSAANLKIECEILNSKKFGECYFYVDATKKEHTIIISFEELSDEILNQLEF